MISSIGWVLRANPEGAERSMSAISPRLVDDRQAEDLIFGWE